ncbi:MAG: DUF885 family protein [Acidobacteriia bacterium]|nr:DUF885 family protein [Terriglobia bacterium]
MRCFSIFLGTSLLTLAGLAAGAPAPSDLDARRRVLSDLMGEQWEYTLSTKPEYASILGDKRWNDRVRDFSQKRIEANIAKTREFLSRFEAIDTTGFPEQEALNKTLMVRQLRQDLEAARFKDWEMPVTQVNGVHIDYPQLVSLLSFVSVKDYEDFISRMKQLPRLFDETMIQMGRGRAEGLIPPKFLLEKVAAQAEGIARMDPEKTPFAEPLGKFPESISKPDRERLQHELIAAIQDSVLPAYERFARFVKEEYAPHGRTEVGVWALPDGVARYEFAVRTQTTSNMTPEEIHQLGLREVARIEGEMTKTARTLGYSDLKSLKASLAKNPSLHAKSREQILELYRGCVEQMQARLPMAFGRLPKAKVEVMAVEPFREKEAPGAEYIEGTPDGSRPGHIMVNTGSPESRMTIAMESTAYHEGVPGHHMQISIAQELPTLPPFRQHAFYNAFTEGWALYSEELGFDVGLFKDPYSAYGHWQAEMGRAIRLVVDTGLHHKHWSRQQVVDFFHAHVVVNEGFVQSETDRYIVWPGQALGYKIGQLKILELREHAKKELGARFDIRKFHDEVLDAGALPLDVLEARISRWIAAQKSLASEGPQ